MATAIVVAENRVFAVGRLVYGRISHLHGGSRCRSECPATADGAEEPSGRRRHGHGRDRSRGE